MINQLTPADYRKIWAKYRKLWRGEQDRPEYARERRIQMRELVGTYMIVRGWYVLPD